jgi:GNAT superfamily N-acetyltransferase
VWCGTDAHLQELDVAPDWGRRGIGRRLVARVVAWASTSGCERVTLTTFTAVPWNAPFYERLGFAALDPTDWTDALRDTWEHERAMGLPMDQRIVMAAPTT